jgi:hypothetical protein
MLDNGDGSKRPTHHERWLSAISGPATIRS